MMTKTSAAYSLVELLIVVIFLGIISVISVPRLNFSAISKQRAETVARKIVTDLRRTRRLAISNAAVNTAGFELNMTGSAPYTGYQIQNLNTSETVDSQSIDSSINCTGGSRFQFGPLGNLLTGSDNQLIVSASGETNTIDITAATGMIKCTEN
jgi:Tfp pilus assembly protein FimT